MKLIYFKRS